MNSEQLAWRIRRHGIEMAHLSGGSHIGSILSVADILAVLYADAANYLPDRPNWENRDRIIMSKGHASAALYAVLAECGFFPVEMLEQHYRNGSTLSGHVSHFVPGVEMTTGSLGHGLSAGAGMAYVAKKDGKNDHLVYVVMGDGECDEGSVWETALFANHFRLNNLIAIIDRNRMQSLDFCENTLELGDLAKKWETFGWHAIETDGNKHVALKTALEEAKQLVKREPHKPCVIIADTVKGYGIPFMQHDILWHYRFPHDGWEYDCAVSALHACMPDGVTDPYTPNGIENPQMPAENDDIYRDHTLTHSWNTSYSEQMRRTDAEHAGK